MFCLVLLQQGIGREGVGRKVEGGSRMIHAAVLSFFVCSLDSFGFNFCFLFVCFFSPVSNGAIC